MPNKADHRLRRQLRRFVLLSILLFGAYGFFAQTMWYQQMVMKPHLGSVARSTAGILRRLGLDATSDGTVVSMENFDLRIARGCDAITGAMLLLTLMAAFPAPLLSKLAGAALGCAALIPLNLVRTSSLAIVGNIRGDLFDFAHRDLWQTAYILTTLGLFAAWVRWSARAAPPL